VSARRAADGALNVSKTSGQEDCRTATVQRRLTARSRWVATVSGGSKTLDSRTATVPNDPTTQRRAAYASDVVRR
jgi:hypothetical protein